jgi:hypothetical protein
MGDGWALRAWLRERPFTAVCGAERNRPPFRFGAQRCRPVRPEDSKHTMACPAGGLPGGDEVAGGQGEEAAKIMICDYGVFTP